MRITLLIAAVLLCKIGFSQNTLMVFDMSQKQLPLMEKYKNADAASRNKVFTDSLYTPYTEFWNGYLGNADDVVKWLNNALPKLPEWQQKNKTIDGGTLRLQLQKTIQDMTKLTGYAAKGKWYIVYGPAWTNLGGLGDFAMVIDLAHKGNESNEAISQVFPHELTHQIMTNVNKFNDATAISSIIGEGFAVWMSQKYWKEKQSLAQHLGYSEEELKACEKNMDEVKKFFEANKFSGDKKVINVFRDRGQKLNSQLPGAIGYYVGYKIVDAYVLKNGVDSWKDVFVKSPKEIYEMSGF